MPDSDLREPNPRQARRIFAGLTVALALWGIYLAIGATGAFLDTHLWDPRKSLIVVACSAGFLVFWWTILGLRARRTSSSAPISPWNWPSVLSCIVACFGLLLGWFAARQGELGLTEARAAWLGITAVALLASSVILALIGASNPRPQRGKLLALLTFALLLIAIVLFLWRPAT